MEGKRGRLKIELALWLATAACHCGFDRLGGRPFVCAGADCRKAAQPKACVDAYSLMVAGFGLWPGSGSGGDCAWAHWPFCWMVFLRSETSRKTCRTPNPRKIRAPVFADRRRLLAALAVLIGLWFGQAPAGTHVRLPDHAEVIGHRGAAALRPENTMAAVLKAIEDGADWVEIDVQETADDVVIVAHDSDFMKLAGVNLKVWDATMEDVARDRHRQLVRAGISPRNARRPCARCWRPPRGKSKVLIELKYYGHDVDLENRVANLVEETGRCRTTLPPCP